MADRAPSRRDLFRIAGTAGAASALVTGSVTVTEATADGEQTRGRRIEAAFVQADA